MKPAMKAPARALAPKGPPRVNLGAKKWPPSIFEEVLQKVNKDHGVTAPGNPPGKLIQLIREYQGGRADNQMVSNWRQRGYFPTKWMNVIAHVSGVSLDRLMYYHDNPYPDKEFDAKIPK